MAPLHFFFSLEKVSFNVGEPPLFHPCAAIGNNHFISDLSAEMETNVFAVC